MGFKTRRLNPDIKVNYLGSRRAYNAESVQISAGLLVHVSSHDADSGLPKVTRSSAGSSHQPTHVARTLFGASSGSDLGSGVLADWHMVNDIDTSALDVGDPVFLGANGAYITDDSALPGGVQVGEVTVSDATKGQIELNPGKYAQGGGLVTRKVTIANAAVRTLNATPVELIPAPGEDKFIEIDSVVITLSYGSAAFDGVAANEDLQLRYNNGSGAQVVNEVAGVGFADQTNDEVRFRRGVDVDPTAHANHAVMAVLATGEWYAAAGDSDLVITLRYRVVSL